MDFNVDVHVKTTGKEQIDALEKQINDLKSETVKINVDVDSKNFNPKKLNIQNVGKQIQHSFDSSIKSVKFNSGKFYEGYLKQAREDVEEAKKISKKFGKELTDIDTNDIDKNALKIAKAKSSAEAKYEREQEKQYQQLSKIRERVLSGSFEYNNAKTNSLLNRYDGQDNNDTLKRAWTQFNEVKRLQSELSSTFSSNKTLDELNLIPEDEISKAKQLDEAMSQLNMTIKTLGVESSKSLNIGVAERSANTVKKYYEENSKAVKKYGVELNDLENKYRSIKTTAEKSDLDNQFKNLKSKISAEGLTGKSFREELNRGFKQIGQFAVTYGAIQKLGTLITNSIGELKEIDSVLTEISKTSDLTDKQIKQLGKDSFESASKYGRTAKDYLIGVQEMSRSGFYGKQGEQLAELSILGQAAGDMTSDVSNSYLLATNAAYNYAGSVEKLNTVLDGQNMITNRNSVNMTDMAEATSKAASMASQTGVKINELSAVIGTAVARTKQEGNVIGTSLKSLFVNLQDTSNEKIVNTFDELGISQIKYVNGSKQLKTPIELLKELSVAYNELPEGSTLKADVLRNIGQKRQANVLAAILGGMSSGDYDKMLSDYSQGKGSAAVEAAKSADNWEGNLNKLSNAWTSFINNFTDTDLIIGGTKALTDFVGVLDTLTSNPLLTAGTFGSSLGIIGFLKNLDEPINHRVSA